MSILAEVHLPLAATVTVSTVLFLAAVLYWRRLGRASVPPPRRRVRRLGIGFGIVLLPAATVAMSVADPDTHPDRYLLAWGVVAALVPPAVVLALLDVAITVRHHRRSLERRAIRDAARIRRAVQAGRSESPDRD